MLKWLGSPIIVLCFAQAVTAQTEPTQAEKDAWAKDPKAQILESSPCKKVTWLTESEAKLPAAEKGIHTALGWYGRGFIEGATYMIGDKALKAAGDFGLSVDVVAAHITTYCYGNPNGTPADAVQDLLLKVLQTAK